MCKWLDRTDKINKELKRGCYLFGAGINGEWVLDYCNKKGIEVLGFIDNSEEKTGTLINHIKVVSYTEYLQQNGGGNTNHGQTLRQRNYGNVSG